MNSLEKYMDDVCHGNAIVASYWLHIDENRLFELMGIPEREIPPKLLYRAKQIEPAASEVAALQEVINDLLAKQERFVSIAMETIQIFEKDNQ